eukprot:scaffold351_cov120-Cylindrotheca_fusiformis.AAC.3
MVVLALSQEKSPQKHQQHFGFITVHTIPGSTTSIGNQSLLPPPISTSGSSPPLPDRLDAATADFPNNTELLPSI